MKTLSLKRWRDIKRQKWQFVAVVVTVVLGVSMFAGTFNAYLNLGSSLEGSYERLGMADMTVTGANDGFRESVVALPGVSQVIERRPADLPFEIGDFSLIGRIIAMPPGDQPAINMIDIEDGEYLQPGATAEVAIESHTATDFGLGTGDTFTIAGLEVTVGGIAVSPEYLWPAKDAQSVFTAPKTFAVAFVDEALLADTDSPFVSNQVLVLYEDGVVTEDVDIAIEGAASTANASSLQRLADQPSNNTIRSEIGGLQTMAVAFPVLFLLAAGMAIYIVITRLVFSQRGVIGTLRASGFTSKAMSRHYRSYGIGVGLAGAAIGSVFGALLGRGMTAIYISVFGIPDLVAAVHIPTVIAALAFGATAGAIASIPPARSVARLAPAEAMRGDIPTENGKRSIFETLIPPLRRAPVRWRMMLRGIGRNKRRSGSMIVGVVLAMTLILASSGMVGTMLSAINRQFGEIAIEDVSVVFETVVGDDQLANVLAVQGVATVEPVLGMTATLSANGASYPTRMEGYERDTEMHGFPEPLPTSGIFVGGAVQDLLGVEVGDEITIEFASIGTTITTTIVLFLDEPLGTVAYMEADALRGAIEVSNPDVTPGVLAGPLTTTVKALYGDTEDSSAVIASIRQLPDVAAAIDATQMRETVESYQVFFFAFIGMMVLFGGAMAFALIFNTISVNVAERSGEFASMRANGLTHRRVAAMVAGENMLLTAMGIVPGLLVGYVAAAAFMESFSDDQFLISLNMRPMAYIGTVSAMFIVAGLSLMPALRAVKRIQVGEIVRERSV